MKFAAIANSLQERTNFTHLLRLSTALESAYGAGVMTANSKQKAKADEGWTTTQLLALSNSKNLFS
ncbi:hypothetical protein [cf. Phormidesmis sp. LEGE 11477]|uniref:hypothetical protein n=1 Tax=cf. Phormidesmis sp. LEGE 11477 TaxID=1828680 RepID=UPI0018822ED7|nr:hypothetical protein [cf. Phormidesmis sp. LEGE 11477]MBE9060025.1 hypothetical protein [cf. Phormidesmis sp. LEGE 11477]